MFSEKQKDQKRLKCRIGGTKTVQNLLRFLIETGSSPEINTKSDDLKLDFTVSSSRLSYKPSSVRIGQLVREMPCLKADEVKN